MSSTLAAQVVGIALRLALVLNGAAAEYVTVVIEKPFHSRSLTGITLDPSGAILPGTEVTDFDPQFGQVFASSTSDEHGYFSLPQNGRTVHHFRFMARGMNPLEITVDLRLFAPNGVRVKLPIGG